MSEIIKAPFRMVGDSIHHRVVYPLLTSGEAVLDREIAHERALNLMENLQQSELLMKVFGKLYEFNDPIIATSFAGVKLPRGPAGIAAGFDKDVRVPEFLSSLGISYIKEGSICLLEWGGNERPRIFPLPLDEGMINRMGFPGNGSESAERKLKMLKRSRNSALVVNIAASKPSFQTEKSAIKDYVRVAKQLSPYGNWHEVNVSSPNTEGVRGLQEPEVFRELALEISKVYKERGVAFTFKFSPDLEETKLLADVRTAIDYGAAGVVVTNTTTDNSIRATLKSGSRNEQGGISGKPLTLKALEVSHIVSDYAGNEIEINRAGGVADAEDLWNALTYGGAQIVDVYTAFIESRTSRPSLFRKMTKDLARAMRVDGMNSMDDFKHLRGKWTKFPKI